MEASFEQSPLRWQQGFSGKGDFAKNPPRASTGMRQHAAAVTVTAVASDDSNSDGSNSDGNGDSNSDGNGDSNSGNARQAIFAKALPAPSLP